MARSLRSTATGAISPALRVWDRIPIRVQGRITVVLPLVAVLVSALLATVRNHRSVAIETDTHRKTAELAREVTDAVRCADRGVVAAVRVSPTSGPVGAR